MGNLPEIFFGEIVINMDSILVQDGVLERVGTGFVIRKLKIELLVILDFLKVIKFLMVESKYIRV